MENFKEKVISLSAVTFFTIYKIGESLFKTEKFPNAAAI